MVALKVLKRYSQKAEDDFMDAIQGAAALNHPHIVPYFDAGAVNDLIYLSMPFIPDGNLEARVTSKPMSEADALKQFTALAEALSYAYIDFQLTHQNVKTANILFDEEHDCILLTDVGLASWTAKHCGSGTNWLPGSAKFTPPERTLGESVNWRGDQYSLGIVLFTMLTGAPPFEAEDERQTALMHVKKPLMAPELANPSVTVSEETKKFLAKMTQKDPDARCGTWKEVIDTATACMAALEAAKQKSKQAASPGARTSSLPPHGFPPRRPGLPPRPPAPRPFGGPIKPLPFKKKI